LVQSSAHPIISALGRGLGLAAISLLLAGPANAQTKEWVPDTNICARAQTTYDMTQCLEARAAFWDKRLNQAYQALTKMIATTPEDDQARRRQEQLRDAQRLWLKYRAANCKFYFLEEGTIRETDTAECDRRMTQDRAIELQAAGPH
jgi:uncharacterized protein YecT (DUF1311 family)